MGCRTLSCAAYLVRGSAAQSFSKRSLNTCWVPGAVLDTRGPSVNRIDKSRSLQIRIQVEGDL